MTVWRRSPGLAAWCVVGLVLVALRLGFPARPAVTHDAFQYLSAAAEAREGRIGRTAIVHFDAERSFGTVPAPLVTFPMGFPLAVAGVSAAGVDPETAGAIVSGTAFLVTLVLLWGLAGRAGVVGGARTAAMLLTAASGALLQFAATISTELLFTAVITAGFLLLVRARATARGVLPWALAGLVLGLGYHVRYAGLFLVAGLGPVFAWHLVIARDRTRALGAFVAGATATAVVLVGFARNIALVGNWRGGNEKVVSHPLGEVLTESVRAAHGLVFGPGWGTVGQSLALRTAVALVAAAGVVWVLTRRDAAPAAPADAAPDTGALRDLAILVAVYCAGMVYAALTSVISYGTRMFVPLIPVLALLAAGAVQALAQRRLGADDRRRFATGAAALLAVVVAINLTSLARPRVDRVSIVRAQLAAATSDGRTVREVLEEALGEHGVLIANNGQAIGYVLGRPTVSLVGPRYSVLEWDEASLRAVAQRYNAAAVLITAPSSAQPDEPDMIPTPFIRALATGQAPAWLRSTGRVGPMTLYIPSINSLEP